MEVNQAIPKKKKVKFLEQTDEEKAFLKKIQKDSSHEGSSDDNWKFPVACKKHKISSHKFTCYMATANFIRPNKNPRQIIYLQSP